MYFTVIISAFKNLDKVRHSIESVYAQQYLDFEILVCSDGDDKEVKKLVESYGDKRIKYYFVPFEGQWGCRSKTEMSQIAEGDAIIYLDQDDEIYKNCFFRITEEWTDDLGVIIFRINHQIGVIPKDEKIEHRNIDTLNGVTKTSIAKRCEFKNIAPSADSRFYKAVTEICNNEGYKVKFIKDVLGVHN